MQSLNLIIFTLLLLSEVTSIATTTNTKTDLRKRRHNQQKVIIQLSIPSSKSKKYDDLIRSGTMSELAKHGLRLNDINDMLMGNEGGDDSTETERVASSVPSMKPTREETISSPIPSSSGSSWLASACEFVKERHVVTLPQICLSKFPKYIKISSRQRRKCHKLDWDCVQSAPIDNPIKRQKDVSVCKKKHRKCMSKSMDDHEIMGIFYM
jgi:hypothetical protein